MPVHHGAAAVTTGQKLSWRNIGALSGGGPHHSFFFTGHFDKDADGEMLLANGATATVYKLDGSSKQVDLPSTPYSPLQAVYDYDGDGVDDLIVDDFELLNGAFSGGGGAGATDHMEAFDLADKDLGPVAGHPMGPQVVTCDLDGDGKRDLFMSQAGKYGVDPSKGVRGFGAKGQVIFSAGPDWNSPYVIAGDLDGDGKDEIIGQLRSSGLSSIGIGKPAQSLAGGAMGIDPTACLDLDGDKHGELIAMDGTVVNLVTGKRFTLDSPPGGKGLMLDGMFSGNVVSFSQQGQRRLAALTGPMLNPDTLMIWDGSGHLTYSEQLGEECHALRVVKGGGQDHLALLTSTRLLIWP